MKVTTLGRAVPVVTVDGTGVVSHAGAVLLRELADRVGLTREFATALAGVRQRGGGHDPGRVAVDVAVVIADGGEVISDLRTLSDQVLLHGPVASTATAWRPPHLAPPSTELALGHRPGPRVRTPPPDPNPHLTSQPRPYDTPQGHAVDP